MKIKILHLFSALIASGASFATPVNEDLKEGTSAPHFAGAATLSAPCQAIQDCVRASHNAMMLEAFKSSPILSDPTIQKAYMQGEKSTVDLVRSAVSQLEVLNLENKNLTVLAPTIKLFRGLTTLKLGKNKLTALPDGLDTLPSLSQLWVENNQLETLPSSLENCNSLKVLSCSNNQFEEIPEAVCHITNLNFLYFDQNKLTKVPSSLKNLVNLKYFYLSGNHLTSLPDLSTFKKLKMLSLRDNAFEKIPATLTKMRKLITLDLSHNALKNVQQVVSFLKKRPSLEYVDFSKNWLTLGEVSIPGKFLAMKGFAFGPQKRSHVKSGYTSLLGKRPAYTQGPLPPAKKMKTT